MNETAVEGPTSQTGNGSRLEARFEFQNL